MHHGQLRYEGLRFRVERVSVHHGGRETQRDIIRHPGAVTIVPMVDHDRVCLIRNYRVAVGETLIELPAGTLEADEDPQITARRELEEETGYRARRWRFLREFFLSPGILDEKMRLFVASELEPGPPQREAGEQIENLILPWTEAMALVERGEIHDAKTMLGLLLYDQCRRESS